MQVLVDPEDSPDRRAAQAQAEPLEPLDPPGQEETPDSGESKGLLEASESRDAGVPPDLRAAQDLLERTGPTADQANLDLREQLATEALPDPAEPSEGAKAFGVGTTNKSNIWIYLVRFRAGFCPR